MDAGSSSRDGNPGKGKRPRQSSMDKPRAPKRRGLGVAKLERMRAEEQMKEDHFKYSFNQAHISGPGIGGIQRMMPPYGSTNRNLSALLLLPFARPPSTSGAASCYGNPSNKSAPKTLQLFPEHKEDKNGDSKREGDHDLPVEAVELTSKNLSDPRVELDLELKTPNDPRDELDLELKL